MTPETRYQRLLLGHVDGVSEHIASLAAEPRLLPRAWSYGLACALRAAQPDGAGPGEVPPEPPDTSTASDEVTRVLALGHVHRARRVFVTWDEDREADGLDLGAHAMGPSPAAILEAHLADVDRGRRRSFDHDAVRVAAAETGDAATVIGVAVCRALDAEADGDFPRALAAARRASRMARTEAMPQQEYLANVVLARSRRLVGHPHLAARILRSLLDIASAQWRPWLAWELLLAGATELAKELCEGSGDPDLYRVTRGALRLLDRAAEGDVGGFELEAEALVLAAGGSRRLGDDSRALLGALRPRLDRIRPGSALWRWAVGQTDGAPRGLQGLSAALSGASQMKGALVLVAVGPDHAHRVLAPGHRLLGANYRRLAQSQRQQGRLDTMVAVLALAGREGLRTEALFARVYGFAYDPEIHKGALRKLLARVADWVSACGALHHEADRHWLTVRTPILVADPRCAPPVDVRVLGMLATGGTTSARDAARRLKVPLRTAQAALQSLLEDGSCRRVRSGNRVSYQIEDTTFSEPTRH